MRPLKLKLNAFGPYAGFEEIDFTKMNSIYLITGPTGSGKTTIFDGISFALFGKTSGDTRDAKELKSDFAKGDETCFVELEFSLNGEVYTIRREPTQSMEGRKTKKGHSVELHMPGDKILNKVNEVEEKIESLLGLNAEQFKQIVMLPQGEFKKLIESSTEEKEVIFRKIFSSKIYKDFQDKLKEKYLSMKKELEVFRERQLTLINKIECGENEFLKQKLNEENLNIIEILDDTKLQIENDKKEIKNIEKEKATKALEVENLTKNIEKIKAVNLKIDRVNSLKLSEKEITNVLSEKEEALKKEEERCDERKLLEKNLNSLEIQIEGFKEYEKNSNNLLIVEKNLKNITLSLKEMENTKKVKKEKIESIEKFLENNKNLDLEILSLETSFKEKTDEREELKDFYLKTQSLKKDISNHKELSIKYENISSDYIKASNEYESSVETMKKQQAGILALNLKEGEPCLVCGSTHHPLKAKILNSSLTEEYIKSLKEKLENIKVLKDKQLQEVSSINGKITELLKGSILEGFKKYLGIESFNKDEIDTLQKSIIEKGSKVKSELENLEKNIKEKKSQLSIKNKQVLEKEAIEKEIEEIEKNIKQLEINEKETFAKCEILKEAKSSFEKTLTSEIKSLKDLEGKIIETKNKIDSIEEALKNAIKEEKEYREKLLKVKQEIKTLEEETLNDEKKDFEKLEALKEEIKIALKEIENREKVVYSRVDNNEKTILSVNAISEKIKEKDEKYSIVSELSNIANGNNSKKITFERYVLAYHFNEILEYANIRFKAMTNERYYLERKLEITDARKGQGLDFDVYDNYTGKTRSIKSLSGGESFKASLALALGLSDVIQSNSGGVRIEAMFVDEGFGTLDPESLEKAIETLIELGAGGKTVGIISHVGEIKERISSKIEILKGQKGSKINISLE